MPSFRSLLLALIANTVLATGINEDLASSQVSPREDVLLSERLAAPNKLGKRFIDAQGNYNISFYHINDVHAHLDEFSSSGTNCTIPSRGCFGGYARVKTIINQTRPSHRDSLFLNVGDEFQGTLFFSYYGGQKIAETLNQMGFDAMTLGNHEFDRGDDFLGDFLLNLTFPIVSANIVSDNPKLNKTIKPFHIFPQYGLAVIGVTTETTPSIASPGKGTKFNNAVEAVQNTIVLVRSTTNITRFAAITHIGYEEDKKLAQQTTGLHLIMGGHSHTLLGSMPNAEGAYPTVVKNKAGDEVFIVTAYRWGEYLGYIDVTYDPQGKILAYNGAPIHLTNTTKQEPELQAKVNAWRGPFEAFAAQEVGSSKVDLDQTTCQRQECLLGDFMADAMITYRQNSTKADFAIINAGGVRASIDAGPITRGEVLTSFPFSNAVVEMTLSGQRVWDTIEGIVSKVNLKNRRAVTSFLQVSRGIRIQYNAAASNGSKLVAISIGGKPLDRAANYQVVTVDFLAGGGDNFFDPPASEIVTLKALDEVLLDYIVSLSPVDVKLDGRISAVNGTSNGTIPTSSGGAVSSTATPAPTAPPPSSASVVGVSMAMLLSVLAAAIFVY